MPPPTERELLGRGLWAVDVSVDVMWKFVEKQMKGEDLVRWLKNNYKGKEKKKLQDVKKKPLVAWDISLLWWAIDNCADLNFQPEKDAVRQQESTDEPVQTDELDEANVRKPENKKDALLSLKNWRNYLVHQRPFKISEVNFKAGMRIMSICYDELLGKEADQFKEELKKLVDDTLQDDLIMVKLDWAEDTMKDKTIENAEALVEMGWRKRDFSVFDAPNLQTLMNAIGVTVKSRWRDIGTGLQVKPTDLDSIRDEEGYRKNANQHCMQCVFQKWHSAMTSEYSWPNLVAVLESPGVEEKRAVFDLYKSLFELQYK